MQHSINIGFHEVSQPVPHVNLAKTDWTVWNHVPASAETKKGGNSVTLWSSHFALDSSDTVDLDVLLRRNQLMNASSTWQ